MTIDISVLKACLWPGGGPSCEWHAYALLDGARDDAIVPLIETSQLPHACLYAGDLSRSLRLAAPYLVQLSPEAPFFNKLVSKGWGQAWGVFAVVQSSVTLEMLRKHLRTLHRVRGPQGKLLVFRFYDPRVMCNYLPMCSPEECQRFFGPVTRFLSESAEPGQALCLERGIGTAPRVLYKLCLDGMHAGQMPDAACYQLVPTMVQDGLTLRPPVLGDAQRLAQATQDLRGSSVNEDAWPPLTVPQAQVWIEEEAVVHHRGGAPLRWSFVIDVEGASAVTGMLYVHWPVKHEPCVEMAYWVSHAFQGRGLASRAVRMVSQWLFAHAQVAQVRLEVGDGNQPSREVAERCGFELVRQGDGTCHYALNAPLRGPAHLHETPATQSPVASDVAAPAAFDMAQTQEERVMSAMLLIRPEQRKAFDELARREFDRWLLAYVLHLRPSVGHRFEEGALAGLLQKVVTEARHIGMDTASEVVGYVHLAVLLGPGWLDDPRTPWAGAVFRRGDLTGEQKLRVARQIVRASGLEAIGHHWDLA